MNNEVWLSPMEGVSDLGFRNLCINRGADMTFTEMIRADAIVRGNKATLSLIDTHIPLNQGIQLLVSKPAILRKALERIDFTNITGVDLNFGCPSPDVVGKGQGPALLKRVKRMKDLLFVLKKHSPVPCGIKIRLGMNKREKENKVYLRVVELANEAKLDWITVHPKTADQGSQEPIDMNALSEIISIATIPVIGNGFVRDQKSAQKMFDIGCSGVMIARAAIGNPWVFNEIKGYSVTKNFTKSFEEYKEIASKFGTKQKFFNYHKKIFALRDRGDMAYHAPSRIDMY
jgi:tRNA-dihydrouridine synthase B